MQFLPKVSVLIPTYNYAHFLDETIQSVLNQTFTDFELIIVDNCSTDHTVEVIKKYLVDNRVSFYRNGRNIGLVGNWNKCLEYAKGEYIKFLCADDKFYPQLLEKYVAVMEQFPSVSIVSSYNENFGSSSCCRMTPYKGFISGQIARRNLIGKKNWLFAPTSVMFRKSDLKVGRFNSQLLTLTDFEFYLRLLKVGDCYIIPECLSCIRVHSETQTAMLAKKKHEIVFEKYRYLNILKNANLGDNDFTSSYFEEQIKLRTVRCAAIMYEVLPKIYKKENRVKFKKAYMIGYSEKVLLKPLSYYFKWKYITKLIRGK